MSSQKKRETNGKEDSNKYIGNKKAKTIGQHDFLSDGLNNDAIRIKVKEILSIIQDKKATIPHADIVKIITEDSQFNFFIERYPMLFDMITKDAVFDNESFEYFLSMRDEIIKNKVTSEEASKEVGQVWFDKFYKEKEK
jgi:hypothetical protein